MKAIVQDTYGSADVLQLRDIAIPQPGRGEVLVRVRAAGADPGVWHMMTGVPYLVRVLGHEEVEDGASGGDGDDLAVIGTVGIT